MNDLKENRKYVFSVEGETEKLYLDWLQDEINKQEKRKYNVIITSKVEKSPIKFVKQQNPISTEKIIHICDFEGNTAEEEKVFHNILSELHEASCKIKYNLAYSNLTFELWIILHNKSFNTKLISKKDYLKVINECFIVKKGKKFNSLDEYKEEKNFLKCLSKLTIENVKTAIKNAKHIMIQNLNNGLVQIKFKGYCYYTDNPSLTIGDYIEDILKEVGLL